MKKTIISMFIIASGLFIAKPSEAQVSVGVHVNIGDQPSWGPSGYDYAEYYYLPDIESYYCVPRRQFVYLSGGRWVFAASLPSRYARYDLYSGYKVVLRDPYAYRHFDDHRVRYARYRNYHDRQPVIIRSHDNGNHYGHYKNRGWHGKGRGHRH